MKQKIIQRRKHQKIHCTYVAYINQKQSFVSFFETLPQNSNSKKYYHCLIPKPPSQKCDPPTPKIKTKEKYPYKQTLH